MAVRRRPPDSSRPGREGVHQTKCSRATSKVPSSSSAIRQDFRARCGECFRAVFFYLFLVFITRIVGRRPGKQLTPFEFVLVFFMGGLALTAMVGPEASFTNSFTQIITIASTHYLVAVLRSHSSRLARLFDDTALVLLQDGEWRSRTLNRMGIQDSDVMASARDQGIPTLDKIDRAILERNGEISIIPKDKSA